MRKTLKQLIFMLFERSRLAVSNNRAEAYLSDLPPFKVAEIAIKGTTYIVNSFFKKDGMERMKHPTELKVFKFLSLLNVTILVMSLNARLSSVNAPNDVVFKTVTSLILLQLISKTSKLSIVVID